MEAREMLSKVNDISNKLKVLLKANDEETIATVIHEINIEISEVEKEIELKDFVTSLKHIITIFSNNPNDDDVKNRSFLRLLSIISNERSRIIEKYMLCSEPE